MSSKSDDADLAAAGMVRSREGDPARAREIALSGCIIRSLVGSNVHGLGMGTDDRDEMGVCVEPQPYILGLREFEHFVYRTQAEGRPSGQGDLDLTIYGLRKYARMAVKGSPTVLLLLFVPEQHLIVQTETGRQLQALAPAFVSRHAGRSFLGYLQAQRRGLIGQRHATRTRERSDQHGYDTKYAMHALRIGHQGEELLTTGRITLPIREPCRSELMAVRRGEPPLVEILDRLDDAVHRIGRLVAGHDLPQSADEDAVDRFLIDAYGRFWAGDA